MSAASINNVIGKRFIKLLRVESTNNYAMQKAQSGNALHGDVFFAFEQTAGRGQFNKQWSSAKGENIILSVVIDTGRLSISQQYILNMTSAISVMQLFNKYSTENIRIKWPNDIYWRDRKAAGILIENIVRGKKWQFAIAGFGININQTVFNDTLKNPVSLKQITGKTYDVVELAKELCVLLDKNLQPLFSSNNNVILETYNKALYKLNEVARFKQGSRVFSGVVKHVDNSGMLVVESGIEESFETGQLEWIL